MEPKGANKKTPARVRGGPAGIRFGGGPGYDPSPFRTITAVLHRMKKSNSRPQLRT